MAAEINVKEVCNLEREKLLDILACIGDGVIITDLNGYITFMNSAAENLTDWKYENAKGRGFGEVFPLAYAVSGKPLGNSYQAVVNAGASIGLKNQSVLVTKDGVKKYVSASCAPVKNTNGIMDGTVVIFRDITKIKALEMERINEISNFKALVNSAQAGIFIMDENMVISSINNAALSLFKKVEGQILGKRFGDGFCCRGSIEDERGCGYGTSCQNCELRKAITLALKLGRPTTDMEWDKTCQTLDYMP
jgi:PAS domain S-box-containing protein